LDFVKYAIDQTDQEIGRVFIGILAGGIDRYHGKTF
jgi:hypothetical protein